MNKLSVILQPFIFMKLLHEVYNIGQKCVLLYILLVYPESEQCDQPAGQTTNKFSIFLNELGPGIQKRVKTL